MYMYGLVGQIITRKESKAWLLHINKVGTIRDICMLIVTHTFEFDWYQFKF